MNKVKYLIIDTPKYALSFVTSCLYLIVTGDPLEVGTLLESICLYLIVHWDPISREKVSLEIVVA